MRVCGSSCSTSNATTPIYSLFVKTTVCWIMKLNIYTTPWFIGQPTQNIFMSTGM